MATLKIDLRIAGLDFPDSGCNEFELSLESEYTTDELLELIAQLPETLRNLKEAS